VKVFNYATAEGKLVGNKQRQDDFLFTHIYFLSVVCLHVDRELDIMGSKIRQFAYVLNAGLLVFMLTLHE